MAASPHMPMSYAKLPTEVPMLYHEGASLNCQRVRLAFAEKGINYQSRIIVIHDYEHLEPWFLKIQPLGTVPAVMHGPIRMIETEAIILYLDQITTGAFTPKLQPDLATKEGQKAAYFQKLLKGINVELIVTGSGCFRNLTANCQLPSFATETFLKNNLEEEVQKMKRLSQKHDDLRYEYLNMSEFTQARLQALNEPEVMDALEHCNKLLNEVESELAKREQEYNSNPSGEKPWLCGQNFTIADIYLSTLLHSMVLAGQKERLWGNGYRPLIASYYERVRHRQTFQESCMWANEVYSSVILPMMTYKARKSAPYVFGFAAAAVGITIAAMIYYKGLPSLKR